MCYPVPSCHKTLAISEGSAGRAISGGVRFGADGQTASSSPERGNRNRRASHSVGPDVATEFELRRSSRLSSIVRRRWCLLFWQNRLSSGSRHRIEFPIYLRHIEPGRPKLRPLYRCGSISSKTWQSRLFRHQYGLIAGHPIATNPEVHPW